MHCQMKRVFDYWSDPLHIQASREEEEMNEGNL